MNENLKINVQGDQKYIPQRLTTLDLARFIAMVMMIQGHTIYALGSPDLVNIEVFPWNVWHFFRGFTAPVFLMVSGAVHVFANKRDESGKLLNRVIKRRIKIALILMAIGYFLAFPCDKIWDLFYIGDFHWTLFFQVNILQLFGVTLLMLLSAFVFTQNDRQLRIVSITIASIIIISAPFVVTVNWFAILPEFFAAYLSRARGSLFPVFPFSAYVFLGAALGTVLKTVEPEKRTKFIMKWGVPSGIIFATAGFILEYFQSNLNFAYYNATNSEFYLFFERSGFVLIGLTIVSLLYMSTKSLTKYYTIFGRRALFIYVGHLILLYGSAIFPSLNSVYAKSLGLLPVLICVVTIEAVTLFAAYFYEYTIKNYKASVIVYRVVVIIYLLFVLFI